MLKMTDFGGRLFSAKIMIFRQFIYDTEIQNKIWKIVRSRHFQYVAEGQNLHKNKAKIALIYNYFLISMPIILTIIKS